jgi:hypothetical protein
MLGFIGLHHQPQYFQPITLGREALRIQIDQR